MATALAGTCEIGNHSATRRVRNRLLASWAPNLTIPSGKKWVIEAASAACTFDPGSESAAGDRISL